MPATVPGSVVLCDGDCDKNANTVLPPSQNAERRVKISELKDDHGSNCAAGHVCRRNRTMSTSKSEDHLMTTDHGMKVYTKGRPPWYDIHGQRLKKPYFIGICGGSASGKTTVAKSIIERLGMQWVTVLSMDAFYKVLTPEQHELAAKNEYNFDTPAAFDFDLLYEALKRLSEGKSVDVPVYDFTHHKRDVNTKVMYGADVLIFEGILAFHMPEIVDLMDIKIFVDTDADSRLARRLSRDTGERGRDIRGVLDQYIRHVKPAFEQYIAPGAKVADVIIPRGGENLVAIDLIVRQVKTQLTARGYDANKPQSDTDELTFNKGSMPTSLHIVENTPQVQGLHTFIRNRDTPRDEFVFYSERLMRILIEYAINFIPYEDAEVVMPNGKNYHGKRRSAEVCGVAVMRSGETFEKALRSVVKDCKVGKILIQTNEMTMVPELYFLRLPRNVCKYKVLLMDATVGTGSCATMAIRILLDHDVLEENIILCALLMAQPGIQRIAYSFPRVKLITTAVDPILNEYYHIIPGMGNFGDRYFGTEFPSAHKKKQREEKRREVAQMFVDHSAAASVSKSSST
uniref:Uridine kinase n=1 Tax=Panagrellus redivivus TaxID=6233 RepID=A0A7E4W6D1_PANRE